MDECKPLAAGGYERFAGVASSSPSRVRGSARFLTFGGGAGSPDASGQGITLIHISA